MHQEFGYLTVHMAVHIAMMNALAPLAAWFLRDSYHACLRIGIAAATVLQVGFLWALHIPATFTAMMGSPLIALALHLGLFFLALLFWREVIASRLQSPWRGAVGLLLSGKLVCLLGVLMLFSDRPLYILHHVGASGTVLADQQLAGMLMLIACPLTYIFGAIWLVSRWLTAIDRGNSLSPHSG